MLGGSQSRRFTLIPDLPRFMDFVFQKSVYLLYYVDKDLEGRPRLGDMVLKVGRAFKCH